MTTIDATRASAEAMPETSDLLIRAIKRHRAAYAYFESATYLSDSGVLGREPTDEDWATWKAANDAERTALDDVCRFPSTSPADLAAKARHLLEFHSDRHGHLEEDQVALFLEEAATHAQLHDADRPADAADGELSPGPAAEEWREAFFAAEDPLNAIKSRVVVAEYLAALLYERVSNGDRVVYVESLAETTAHAVFHLEEAVKKASEAYYEAFNDLVARENEAIADRKAVRS